MDNYVKCFRQLSDHRIWLAEPFTRGQAFWDLVMLANHKENSFMVRGNLVTVKRGQVGRSEESWSKRWKWSRCKVRAFWSFLIQQNMIKIDRLNSRLTTIVTLPDTDRGFHRTSAEYLNKLFDSVDQHIDFLMGVVKRE